MLIDIMASIFSNFSKKMAHFDFSRIFQEYIVANTCNYRIVAP